MTSHGHAGAGYWYGPDERLDPSGAVLGALRAFRIAELATRRSASDSMGMGETDLLALRYLLRAQADGEQVGPKDLSRVLSITTASTTSLIDRLVAGGNARREPHPTDKRALVIVPTVSSDSEVRTAFGGMHHRMMAVVESLSAEEAHTVIKFLRGMTGAFAEPLQP
jgi:DNA-binding MarR family transcriptional regulator